MHGHRIGSFTRRQGYRLQNLPGGGGNAQFLLQLSNQAETFGRTVVEALSLGVPVVGYAHGGVGELLAELYPEGAVPVGDVDAAAARVASILRDPPVLRPLERYRLEDMQRATIALYESLAGDRLAR